MNEARKEKKPYYYKLRDIRRLRTIILAPTKLLKTYLLANQYFASTFGVQKTKLELYYTIPNSTIYYNISPEI